MQEKQEKKGSFVGTITRGLGEGAYFISMEHYQNQIMKNLGFKAYPGTLNLKTSKSQIQSIKTMVPIQIDGFEKKGKRFGGANCYRASLRDVNGAIIMPHISKHKDIIEFIAPIHLKSSLSLKDGDKVKVEII